MKLRVVFEPRANPHAHDLYDCAGEVEGVDGLDAVGEGEVSRYREEGFLLVRRAFSPELVEAARQNLRELGLSERPETESIYYEGTIRELLPELGGAAANEATATTGRVEDLALGVSADRLPDLEPEVRLRHVRKLMGFAGRHSRLDAMALRPELMDVLSALLGAPAKLFQDMAMVKPPGGREKPWHQDRAYFNLTADTPVVAAWIALDPATLENGCMRMIARGHRQGPRTHFLRRDWQICDTAVEEREARVAAPMNAGDCLLFDALLPHGTPRNDTSERRWALQFHYVPIGTEEVGDDERLQVFGSEGKDVTC